MRSSTHHRVHSRYMDRFKSINDAFGHRRGDQALAEVGLRLRQAVRHLDEVYRPGGDEFAILLPYTDGQYAAQIAERVRQHVSGAPLPGEPPLSVGLSIGCAAFPEDG